MVLLVAALYTFYQNARRNQKGEPSPDNNSLHELHTVVQDGAEQLYQQAVLRCNPNMETSQDESSLLVSSSTGQEEEEEDTFDAEVRQEWFNAVYGPDFLPADQPVREAPQQGVGLAGLSCFKTYQAVIPANSVGQKVGVTISRLPLGLYVRSVAPGSEAALLGIPYKSVLVSINGQPLLAEASRPALERIWYYEGLFATSSTQQEKIPNEPLDDNKSTTDLTVKEPVALRFIRNGQLLDVLLVSNPPWGITWAPCGNFSLVKRVYSFAAESGVQRGSLLAAVNDRTARDMDHADTALALRALFEQDQEIRLVMSAPARKQHHTMTTTTTTSNHKPAPKLTTHDGIEVKFLPWDIGSLCHAGNPLKEEDEESELHVLAEQVAAGRVVSSVRRRRRPDGVVPLKKQHSQVPSCPQLDRNLLLTLWDPLDSLIYCMQMHQVNYDFTRFVPLPSDTSEGTKIDRLRHWTATPAGPAAAYSFVLQFISIICSPDHYNNHHESARSCGSDLTSMLLKLSRRDEGFCHYLYFLLRSFISTFETRRPSTGGDRNLMALLHCLELLRFAEKELASQPLTGKPSTAIHTVAYPPPSPERAPPVAPSSSSNSPEHCPTSNGPPTPLAASPGSPDSEEDSPASKNSKRGMLGFFRKKKLANKSTRKQLQQQPAPPQPKPRVTRRSSKSSTATTINLSLSQSPSTMYENMSDFLSELDRICATIERSLQKSFRQKIAEWALQPWSASKDTALAEVTEKMRESLRQANEASDRMLLVNPVESSELLSSMDYDECYILPSAHFPILLTFNVSERRSSDSVVGEELLYRTTVELVSLRGSRSMNNSQYIVHAAIAGDVLESGMTNALDRTNHTWQSKNSLCFETRSSWGAPQTLSLRLSANAEVIDQRVSIESPADIGFCWVDLSKQWSENSEVSWSTTSVLTTDVWPMNSENNSFDDHGEPPSEMLSKSGQLELELKVTTECIEFDSSDSGSHSRKRMLLYKHDDDLRQEAFAVQFIRTCDHILKASGLDMMLLTFQCIPVGTRRGFVEWVPGSVPLSEICHPFGGSLFGDNRHDVADDDSAPSTLAKAGLTKYESLRRLQVVNDPLHRLAGSKSAESGSMANNPIQDYLRSVAFERNAPYMIRKEVMDTYVKSCAGYCIITYILGVGDRHLDNLLLHQSGSFFHCDFSFILGKDPKKYLPLRITEEMVQGMGGKDSDNFAKFLSLAGGAFLAFRQPENVRVLLSMVRLMEAALLPDVTENQSIQEAIFGMRNRLRLDLNEEQALNFMEDLIESSLSSKIWMAVDAIHNLGKKIKI